jgi:hypothetical protein
VDLILADGITLADVLGAADTLISTGILAAIVVMFVRGVIISQPVYDRLMENVIERYERITENVIERVVAEVVARILTGVEEMLRSWQKGELSLEVERLKAQNAQLIEELEGENLFLRREGHGG